MRRYLYKDLLNWKKRDDRKPLIINGARQVGKTYLLQEFGHQEYDKMAFFSLDRSAMAASVFEQGTSVNEILLSLSAISNIDITPGNTLIVLDEIQNCPKALEALKYFCEDAPDYHIVVAGSLLGLSLHDGVSYPVGKVEELRLYPMNYIEFLEAVGKEKLAETLLSGNWAVISMLSEEYVRLLRQYYYVGGMPAAVLALSNKKDCKQFVPYNSKSFATTGAISQNMPRRARFHALIWCGTAYQRSWPRKTRSSYMAL